MTDLAPMPTDATAKRVPLAHRYCGRCNAPDAARATAICGRVKTSARPLRPTPPADHQWCVVCCGTTFCPTCGGRLADLPT